MELEPPENSLFIVFLFPLWTLLLVLGLLIFTCFQARRIKTHPKALKIENINAELVSLVRRELDEQYSSIPEEYMDQNSGIVFQDRRFSSSSSSEFSSTSSRCRKRSNSQAAIDSMLHLLISPDSVEDNKEEDEYMEINKALGFFRGVETKLKREEGREGRRVSWHDVNDEKVASRRSRHSRSLDVIIEST